jgi:hypothetical protein
VVFVGSRTRKSNELKILMIDNKVSGFEVGQANVAIIGQGAPDSNSPYYYSGLVFGFYCV